jgi:hypothetical protein
LHWRLLLHRSRCRLRGRGRSRRGVDVIVLGTKILGAKAVEIDVVELDRLVRQARRDDGHAVERGAVARRLDADVLALDLKRDRIAGMRGGGRGEEERRGGDIELVHDNLPEFMVPMT